MLFAALLSLLSTPLHRGGWEATTPEAQLRSARADDVACRRASVVREPGRSLEMDWHAHRTCMVARWSD